MVHIVPIVKEPHSILRKKAAEISLKEIMSARILKFIGQMKETLKVTPDGVGLAAPQIGESVKIFIVSEEAEEIDRRERVKERNELKDAGEIKDKPHKKREWKYFVFIDPLVKKVSKKKLEGPEGCLSVPGKFGSVDRHEKIMIEAYDENGKKFTRGASRFFARVIQHELDHLEGTLFIDKAAKIIESAPVIK